jgi:hypothetical protein
MSLRRNTHFVHDLAGEIIYAVNQSNAWLGNKIHSTQFQRSHRDISATFRQRGDHDDWHGPQAHQPPKELDAVHLGHFDIQRNDVRIQVSNHFARDQRVIGCANALHIRLAIDDFSQQTANQG